MVLRETTFVIGGVLTIGLGIALGAGRGVAGAGLEFFDAWLASGLAVGFGAGFLYVGRSEGRERRRELRRLEEGFERPEGPRPP